MRGDSLFLDANLKKYCIRIAKIYKMLVFHHVMKSCSSLKSQKSKGRQQECILLSCCRAARVAGYILYMPNDKQPTASKVIKCVSVMSSRLLGLCQDFGHKLQCFSVCRLSWSFFSFSSFFFFVWISQQLMLFPKFITSDIISRRRHNSHPSAL